MNCWFCLSLHYDIRLPSSILLMLSAPFRYTIWFSRKDADHLARNLCGSLCFYIARAWSTVFFNDLNYFHAFRLMLVLSDSSATLCLDVHTVFACDFAYNSNFSALFCNFSAIFPQYLLSSAILAAIFTVFTCNFYREISKISPQVPGGTERRKMPCVAPHISFQHFKNITKKVPLSG